jgi:hypothetical protein
MRAASRLRTRRRHACSLARPTDRRIRTPLEEEGGEGEPCAAQRLTPRCSRRFRVRRPPTRGIDGETPLPLRSAGAARVDRSERGGGGATSGRGVAMEAERPFPRICLGHGGSGRATARLALQLVLARGLGRRLAFVEGAPAQPRPAAASYPAPRMRARRNRSLQRQHQWRGQQVGAAAERHPQASLTRDRQAAAHGVVRRL